VSGPAGDRPAPRAARLVSAGAGSGATAGHADGVGDPVRVMVGLGRALDSAGLRVGPDRVAEAVRAAVALDPTRRTDLYWAGRLTLCANPDDLPKYDAVFAALTAGDVPRLRPRPQHLVRAVPVALAVPDAGGSDDEETEAGADTVLRAAASTVETLRHKDVTTLGAAERAGSTRRWPRCRCPASPARPGAAGRRRTRAPSTPAEPCGRCCAPAASPSGRVDPPVGPAPAGGAAGRRQRLDERVRRRAAAVRARGHPPPRRPHRGVHPRHPADQGDQGDGRP
jgi:uncharacterized protein with von Willebrand factor type A (vWA) domain